jgi:GT2 family glycosyltransferase
LKVWLTGTDEFAQRARQAGYVTRLCTTRPVVHYRHGASAERVAIAERSRAVFERTWADLLPTKPDRALLTSDPAAVRNSYRDRR